MATYLSDLITTVRDYIDEPTADNWTNIEITRRINEAHRFYYNKIIQYSEDYFYTTTDYSLTTGTTTDVQDYPLPSDCMRVRRIETTDTPPIPYTIVEMYMKDYYAGVAGRPYALASGQRICFIRGNHVSFRNQYTETARMHYIYRPPDLSTLASDEAFNGLLPEHHDIVAVRAAWMCKVKDEALTSQLQRIEAEMAENLTNTITPRATGLTRCVKDTGA